MDKKEYESKQKLTLTELMRGVRVKQIVNHKPKIGRNDKCPCGSGKKFKHCCSKKSLGLINKGN